MTTTDAELDKLINENLCIVGLDCPHCLPISKALVEYKELREKVRRFLKLATYKHVEDDSCDAIGYAIFPSLKHELEMLTKTTEGEK